MFDTEKFKKSKGNFFWQPLLASIFVVFILIVLGGLKHVNLLGYIGTGSLGSSVFLAFCQPHLPQLAKRMLGGYLISIICGSTFSSLICHVMLLHSLPYCLDIAVIFAMSATMFGMVFLRLEHPPAVGFALGLMVDTWDYYTLFMIVFIVIMMVVVKLLLGRWLINLI